MLVERGAKVDQASEMECTPLNLAATAKIVQYFLDHGADVNTKTTLGWTALYRAVNGHSQPDLVALPLANGADVDATATSRTQHLRDHDDYRSSWMICSENSAADDETPLHWAVKFPRGSPEIVNLLLDHGAELEAWDSCGMTLLFRALRIVAVAMTFVGGGARLNTKDGEGRTAMDLADEINLTLALDGS